MYIIQDTFADGEQNILVLKRNKTRSFRNITSQQKTFENKTDIFALGEGWILTCFCGVFERSVRNNLHCTDGACTY